MMLLDERDWPYTANRIAVRANEDLILITFAEDACLDNGYLFGDDVPRVKIDSFEYYFHTSEFRMIPCEDHDES